MSTHFTDLPTQVLLAIASHLDRLSLVNLAITCSSLQPIAEEVVWSQLDLSIHPSTRHSIVKNRILRIQDAHAWQSDSHQYMSPASYGTIMQDLTNHLQAHPSWIRSVRRISVDIDKLLCEPFRYLLQLISPTLKSLELFPPAFAFGPSRSQSFLTIAQVFLSLNTQLTSLRHLEITPASAHAGGWGRKPLFEQPDGRIWPAMRCLISIEVDEMYAQMEDIITSLLQDSDEITHIALRDPGGCWRPSPNDPLIGLLASQKKLEYLSMNIDPFTALNQVDSLPPLKVLSITDKNVKYNLPLLQPYTIPECDTMTTLYLYGYPTLAQGTTSFAWDEEYQGLPPLIRPIPSSILARIRQSKNLRLILFATDHVDELNYVGREYRSDQETFKTIGRGVLIRTYTTTDRYGKVNTFTHCRSYSAHHTHVSNAQVYHAENVWEEYTDLNGEHVSASVLGEVYRVSGEEEMWIEGGRDLQLPEQAWDVLRKG
ncbi:hypothetical protein V865_000229 [Kwoniella europaea PYCC6329]|uniref:F-box domain-containing protein n=1 Tax=Kwoniella europaea PYCC6329 TaxID=1423913 RepID=A0AAX4K701_9TREE